MPPYLLRLAYMSEFLLAIVAILTLWVQVGGQPHLDLVPWYSKLGLSLGLALATVMGTVSAVNRQRAGNPKTIACLLLALMLMFGMAATTYYVHLHENDDAGGSDDDTGVSTAVMQATPGFAL